MRNLVRAQRGTSKFITKRSSRYDMGCSTVGDNDLAWKVIHVLTAKGYKVKIQGKEVWTVWAPDEPQMLTEGTQISELKNLYKFYKEKCLTT